MKKVILILIIVIAVIIQFFRIDKKVPAHLPQEDFITLTQPPNDIKITLETACYDCHSYKTSYPWYANIAPVSWWLKNHVDEGREHLNFSVWGSYSPKKAAHKIEECYEEVEEGEMPLSSYTLTHQNAQLDNSQKEKLIGWFKKLHKEVN